ncbi:MAG: hypothetical protein HN945_15105 [Deltaproteobacteria bacterium]|nr:hypothetical protein [Deltaproteobacteria bacterium]
MILFKRHFLVKREHSFISLIHQRTHEHVDRQYSRGKVDAYYDVIRNIFQKSFDEFFRSKFMGINLELDPEKKSRRKKKGTDPAKSIVAKNQDLVTVRFDKSVGIELIKTARSPIDFIVLLTEKKRQKFPTKFSLNNFLDKRYHIDDGIQKIIDNTLSQAMYYHYDHSKPNFLNIAGYSISNNPFFKKVWLGLSTDIADSLLRTWHEIIVMIGILGTFIGFFISFQSGGNLKLGVGVAITSSIVGMSLGIIFMMIEKSTPDEDMSMNSLEMLSNSLEIIWNNSKALFDRESEMGRNVDAEEAPESVVD